MNRKYSLEEDKQFIHQVNVLGWSPAQISNFWNLPKTKAGRYSAAYKRAHDLGNRYGQDVSFKQRRHKRKKAIQDGVYVEPDYKNNLVTRLQHLQSDVTEDITEFMEFTDQDLLSWIIDISLFCQTMFGITLQDYQLKMVKMWESSKYSIISSGHQVGKDLTVACYVIWKCITTSNFFSIVVSPAQRQSDELFNRILSYLARNKQLHYCIKRETRDEITFHNGSRIMSLPSRGSITGLTEVNCAIINEAGRPELPERIFDDIMPMTIAKDGSLILLGNPYGDANIFAQCMISPLYSKMRVETKENKALGDMLKKRGTSMEEWLATEAIRLSKREYDQRYLGIPRSMEGAFIDGALINKACKEYAQHTGADPSYRYYCGIDWGRFSNQSCVAVVSEHIGDKTIRVEHIKVIEKKPLDEVEAWVRYQNSKFNFHVIVPEYSGLSIPAVDNMLQNESYSNRVRPYKASMKLKFDYYSNLQKLFEKGLITIPAGETRLITQLRFLEMKITRSMNFLIEGAEDDIVDAVMLACSSVMLGKREIFVSASRYR